MQAEARETPYIHISWLAKVMTGELPCHWQAWFQVHHRLRERVPSGFDEVGWQMNHQRLVTDLRHTLVERGKRPWVNLPVRATVPGSGAVLQGTADLAVVDGEQMTLYACKVGQPRPSDQAQMMIALHALQGDPRWAGRKLQAAVVYGAGDEQAFIPDLPPTFADDLQYFLGLLTGPRPLERAPGAACRRCPITMQDCAERQERVNFLN